MQRMMSKMMNNKIRYKSMKRSSPLAQYKRMILGKHYRNGYGVSASGIVGFPIPRILQERIKEQWIEFQKTIKPVHIRAIRTCDDRIKFEVNA